MDGYIVHANIALARGAMLRIEDARGLLLHAPEGGLWITQDGDTRDYFVAAGERFRLERDGLTVVYAFKRSGVTLAAPVPGHYARRISVMLPGTRLPRVIYDRRWERGGWRSRLRHALTRGWLNAFAPRSIPTTAAL